MVVCECVVSGREIVIDSQEVGRHVRPATQAASCARAQAEGSDGVPAAEEPRWTREARSEPCLHQHTGMVVRKRTMAGASPEAPV